MLDKNNESDLRKNKFYKFSAGRHVLSYGYRKKNTGGDTSISSRKSSPQQMSFENKKEAILQLTESEQYVYENLQSDIESKLTYMKTLKSQITEIKAKMKRFNDEISAVIVKKKNELWSPQPNKMRSVKFSMEFYVEEIGNIKKQTEFYEKELASLREEQPINEKLLNLQKLLKDKDAHIEALEQKHKELDNNVREIQIQVENFRKKNKNDLNKGEILRDEATLLQNKILKNNITTKENDILKQNFDHLKDALAKYQDLCVLLNESQAIEVKGDEPAKLSFTLIEKNDKIEKQTNQFKPELANEIPNFEAFLYFKAKIKAMKLQISLNEKKKQSQDADIQLKLNKYLAEIKKLKNRDKELDKTYQLTQSKINEVQPEIKSTLVDPLIKLHGKEELDAGPKNMKKIKIGNFAEKTFIGNDDPILEKTKFKLLAIIAYEDQELVRGFFVEYLLAGGKIVQGHLFGDTTPDEKTLELKRSEKILTISGSYSKAGVHFFKLTTSGSVTFMVGSDKNRAAIPFKTTLKENETVSSLFCSLSSENQLLGIGFDIVEIS